MYVCLLQHLRPKLPDKEGDHDAADEGKLGQTRRPDLRKLYQVSRRLPLSSDNLHEI